MISLVIPVYNEELVIDELLSRSLSTLKDIGRPFEIIIVDDGSEDGSLQKLLKHREEDKRIKVVELSRNFGHQAAFTAGIKRSKGQYTVMMDGDLQDTPELIKDMFEKIQSGEFDIVNGYRKSRAESGIRGLLFTTFHKLFALILNKKDVENIGNFSMLNRPALEALMQLKEKTRYLPGLRTYVGFKQGFLDYDREGRKGGAPKMRLRHLIKLATDAIFSFSRLPIFICFYLGLLGVIISSAVGLAMIFSDSGYSLATNYRPVLVGLFFLGSVQLAFIGIVGEYVFKGYKESQNRPMYFVRNEYLD
ncbi:MAG: glycosyltransferase family 2 protein [Cytophagales bacterium]|nr:glycosyltransferase family 2 protein [Cytophagales bacterium]